MAYVSVIGAGSWGTAIAKLLCTNGHKVTLWSYREEEVRSLIEKRENLSKLPGVKLPEEIIFTADLEAAVRDKEMCVMAVPSTAVRSTAKKMALYAKPGQIVVNLAKGIEESTLMILTD
ncbi:MAG: NAD(P)-binding domain-containing protein, partial [Lachnospiraceae bacterium]|nr:NAD(P)-binding domain-containing protein [Lachnospiraceae bacterium]